MFLKHNDHEFISPSRNISADKERRTKKRTKIPSKKLFNTFHIAVKMYSDFCNVSKLQYRGGVNMAVTSGDIRCHLPEALAEYNHL